MQVQEIEKHSKSLLTIKDRKETFIYLWIYIL